MTTANVILYLIWAMDHDAWWAPNAAGYTQDITKAGRYTAKEVAEIVARDIEHEQIVVHDDATAGASVQWTLLYGKGAQL